jgi:hypothetical protein
MKYRMNINIIRQIMFLILLFGVISNSGAKDNIFDKHVNYFEIGSCINGNQTTKVHIDPYYDMSNTNTNANLKFAELVNVDNSVKLAELKRCLNIPNLRQLKVHSQIT